MPPPLFLRLSSTGSHARIWHADAVVNSELWPDLVFFSPSHCRHLPLPVPLLLSPIEVVNGEPPMATAATDEDEEAAGRRLWMRARVQGEISG